MNRDNFSDNSRQIRPSRQAGKPGHQHCPVGSGESHPCMQRQKLRRQRCDRTVIARSPLWGFRRNFRGREKRRGAGAGAETGAGISGRPVNGKRIVFHPPRSGVRHDFFAPQKACGTMGVRQHRGPPLCLGSAADPRRPEKAGGLAVCTRMPSVPSLFRVKSPPLVIIHKISALKSKS